MSPTVAAVCSEVGRGHPSYLDSVLAALRGLGRDVTVTSASGPGWRLARAAYRSGARGGIATALYNSARSGARPSGVQLALLDSGLRRRFRGLDGVVLVDHPLLAHLLAPVCRVGYVHGEIAAPAVAAVPAAWRTLVPLPTTRDKLAVAGVPSASILVTGLLVEPDLVAFAEPARTARQRRLSSSTPLSVGLFTSGAYPRRHKEQLTATIRSLAEAGHRAVLFCGSDQAEAEAACTALSPRAGLCGSDFLAPWAHPRIPGDAAPAAGDCSIVCCKSRQDETVCTGRNLAHLDVMVAACHERTNWAVGLGLPLFGLLPHIGPFARENFEFASAQGVCLPLEDAARFGRTLTDLHRSGRLAEMSRAGWGGFPITGAKVAAESLLAAL